MVANLFHVFVAQKTIQGKWHEDLRRFSLSLTVFPGPM